MGSKDYNSFQEAYASIYEQQYEVFGGQRYTVRPDGTLTFPTDGRTKPTPDEVKTLTKPPSTVVKPVPTATPAKPTPIPSAVVKPVSSSATTVSPSPTATPLAAPPQKSFQQELDDLRKASAQATMAGPSKEAQALMSARSKNILGSEKLKAGIEAQQRVEKMKSGIGMSKVETPKPAIGEQRIGIPIDASTDAAAAKKLREILPASEKDKVIIPKSGLQKAGYEYEDLYDEVLDYLISEGYSVQESNRIMVELVNENFWKAVQQRTGIGKPGVGPGQIAKNILRAGISDVLGTSIGAGSAPSVSAPVKAPTVRTQSPAPIVRTSTARTRTAPKGTNIAADPWKGGTTGNRIKDITQKPTVKPTATRALTGSSGPNVRGLLPSSSSSPRGGPITPSVKPGSVTPAAKPTTGKPVSTRIQPVSVREIPSSSRSLGGTNIRAMLPQGARNILPDPWKQATDAASGAKNLWNRVQQITKPQAQLKPSQTNVRGLLPAAKPSATQVAKPATSVRSQQFQDVQRLNRMTGGGLMGELPSTKPTSKPAPKPTGNVDKLPPKPATSTKPAPKPKMPGGGSKLLQGLGTLASLRNLTPLGVAAAVMAPRPTADGTLTSAIRRGDVAPPAPKLPPPVKPTTKPVDKPVSKPTTKPVDKPVSKPAVKPAAPVDPELQRYEKLRKTDPVKAKELGMKIWGKKYRPALEPPDIA